MKKKRNSQFKIQFFSHHLNLNKKSIGKKKYNCEECWYLIQTPNRSKEFLICHMINSFLDHTALIDFLVVLPDETLASASFDHTIRIWNTTTGETIRTLVGHTNNVRVLAVVSDDLLRSGSDDQTVCIWNVKSGLKIKSLTGHLKYLW